MTLRFYKLVADVTARPDLTAADKIVLAVIVDSIGRNGVSWIGYRRLAGLTGLDRATVLRSVLRLEAAGLLAVERRKNGQSNLYRTGRNLQPVRKDDRPQNATTAGRKMQPLPAAKCSRIQTDELKRGRQAAAPPASGNGAQAVVGLWIDLYRQRVGHDFPASGKGRLGGTVKAMLAGRPEGELGGYVRRWFARDRKDFGVALFKLKVEGGDAELVGRGEFQEDPIALRNGRVLAQEGGGA